MQFYQGTVKKFKISFFDKCLNLPYLTSLTVFLGFTNTYSDDPLLKNQILLLIKIYVYNFRKHEKHLLNDLIIYVTEVKNIERTKFVSLTYPRGRGGTFMLLNICYVLLLLNWFICNFFWFELIKNERNITKKRRKSSGAIVLILRLLQACIEGCSYQHNYMVVWFVNSLFFLVTEIRRLKRKKAISIWITSIVSPLRGNLDLSTHDLWKPVLIRAELSLQMNSSVWPISNLSESTH